MAKKPHSRSLCPQKHPCPGTTCVMSVRGGGKGAVRWQSGVGWWEQHGYGRQEMRNLVLKVGPEGETSGSGDDCVGSFTITATISNEVMLVKKYFRRHSLLYVGTNSGMSVFGTWHVPGASKIPETDFGELRLVPYSGLLVRGHDSHSSASRTSRAWSSSRLRPLLTVG